MVAAENRDFWTDQGISIRGMFRAAWVIVRGGDLQGGSTITQQYIKIMYLNSEQTVTRKFRELFLAYKINKEMSKEEILTDYLNTIYFGRGAYGIQAASKAYFDVDAEDLTTQQAAVLISVINNPSLFDPGVDEANIPRLQERYTLRAQLDGRDRGDHPGGGGGVRRRPCPSSPRSRSTSATAGPRASCSRWSSRSWSPPASSPARSAAADSRSPPPSTRRPRTRRSRPAQKYTKQAADASDQKASQLHAAVASVEVGTGEVLALYGGPDYVKNSRNWATTARPTASTFKTYALAAGLKDGFSLDSRFNGNTFTPEGDSTTVRNEFNYQYGPAVTLLKAATDSINTAFVDLTTQMDDGPQQVIGHGRGGRRAQGRRLGPQLPDRAGHRRGQPAEPGERVRDLRQRRHLRRAARGQGGQGRQRQGGLQGRTRRRSERSSKDISRDVTYALSNVVEQGTGSTVRTLDRPVAGKTGTKDVEDDITAAWFVGLHPADLHRGHVRGRRRRQRRPRRLRPARRLHLLRRHLPGADLGRLHADRRRGPAGRSSSRSRRTSTATPPRSRPPPPPEPEPTRTREPTTEAPTQEPTTRGADPGADDRGPDPGADDRGAHPGTDDGAAEPGADRRAVRRRLMHGPVDGEATKTG